MMHIVSLPMPNGVLFIYDGACDVKVPPDTSAGPLLHTNNCITVWTLGEDEGDVDICISNELVETKLEKRASLSLEVCGKEVAIFTSLCEKISFVPVSKNRAVVHIYTDHDRYAQNIALYIE